MDKFIDWHPADIVAGLRKRGTSLAAESRRHAGNAAVGHLAVTLPRPGNS